MMYGTWKGQWDELRAVYRAQCGAAAKAQFRNTRRVAQRKTRAVVRRMAAVKKGHPNG